MKYILFVGGPKAGHVVKFHNEVPEEWKFAIPERQLPWFFDVGYNYPTFRFVRYERVKMKWTDEFTKYPFASYAMFYDKLSQTSRDFLLHLDNMSGSIL